MKKKTAFFEKKYEIESSKDENAKKVRQKFQELFIRKQNRYIRNKKML